MASLFHPLLLPLPSKPNTFSPKPHSIHPITPFTHRRFSLTVRAQSPPTPPPPPLPETQKYLLDILDGEDVKSIPCVRTYENELGRFTVVGDVDLDQALTAAAADGGDAADEHIAHALDVMVAETVFPGHSDQYSTISTRLFLPTRKVKERATALRNYLNKVDVLSSTNILAMTFRQVTLRDLWSFELVLFTPGTTRNMKDLANSREFLSLVSEQQDPMVDTRNSASKNSAPPPISNQPTNNNFTSDRAVYQTSPSFIPETHGTTQSTDPIMIQLSAMASKLTVIDTLAADVAALKIQQGGAQPQNFRFRNRETATGSREGRQTHWSENEDDDPESPWRRNSVRKQYTKIDFPKFEGGDPRGWIIKAEKYFRYYQTPEDLKVDVAAMYLEGDALDLFAWMNRERTLLYWEELVKALQENYGPPEFQNPDEYLCGIRQTGTVQEFRQEFAKRSARVSNWPEHCLLGVFLNGLREELRADVRIHKPRTVYKAMSLALEFENKLGPLRGSRGATGYNNTRPSPYPNQGGAPLSRDQALTIQPAQPTSSSRNWEIEKQNRLARGLCFRCNEKYSPTHRCKPTTFALMELTEGDEAAEGALINETEEQETVAEISLHAILGKTTGSAMKLHGQIGIRSVLILVDSGSTHNFISKTLVHELQISSQKVPAVGVQIGNGDLISCNQICKTLSIHLPGLDITEEFYPFALGGVDVVLGIKWLASLNTVQANWNEMFMIFHVNGKRYKLQGIKSHTSEVALQTLHKITEPPDKREEEKASREAY